jgi:hypothetical protein
MKKHKMINDIENQMMTINIYQSVDYQVLKRVTQHSTRTTTRINCTKLRSLGLIGKYRVPNIVCSKC